MYPAFHTEEGIISQSYKLASFESRKGGTGASCLENSTNLV